jgi:soluble lytic murein transglycosylase-like protein
MAWKRVVMLAGLGMWSCWAASASAEIFMYRDKGGTLHFSNAPANSSSQRFVPVPAQWFLPPDGRSRRYYRAARRGDFDHLIKEMSARYEVEPALVKAVIQAESNFVPHARSPKGALGLMQLMPATARRHNVGRIFDPRENIQGGVKHLRLLLDRYSGNVRKTLAAYNAGEDAVDRHGGVPPYKETIEYLQRVLQYREQYLRER